MKEKKIQEKDQASTIKVKDPANLSKRDRKVSTGQISKTSGKHDKSQLADAAKSESVAKPKHMVFSESGPDIKLRNGGFIPKKKFVSYFPIDSVLILDFADRRALSSLVCIGFCASSPFHGLSTPVSGLFGNMPNSSAVSPPS